MSWNILQWLLAYESAVRMLAGCAEAHQSLRHPPRMASMAHRAECNNTSHGDQDAIPHDHYIATARPSFIPEECYPTPQLCDFDLSPEEVRCPIRLPAFSGWRAAGEGCRRVCMRRVRGMNGGCSLVQLQIIRRVGSPSLHPAPRFLRLPPARDPPVPLPPTP